MEIERGAAHVSIEMEDISLDIKGEDEALIENELQHDPVVTSITRMLKSSSPLSSKWCIYKVPEKLRKANVEAYTPRVVSIGPFHRGEKCLEAMEEHKLRYLQTFLNRTNLSLEDIVMVVRTWEEEARQCYAETTDKLSSDKFVEMILVDGSFIVELLLRYFFPQLIDLERDHIIFYTCMIDDVCHDMILLENQLPFFVLEGLYNLVHHEENPTFIELSREYFRNSLDIDQFPNKISTLGIKHFVDFMHHSCLPSSTDWRKVNLRSEFPPSVTKLHEAGIKFKIGTSCSLLDIKFSNGILEIPHLVIADSTETLFRNLIAFEQCHCLDNYITHYMYLLDDMINTSKDVDLLIHHKIITSRLGCSQDVSTLFNNMGKEFLVPHNFYFSSLCKSLNEYCGTPWHNWKATLIHDYFNTPWKVVSTVVAIVLLVLTFIQTACSVISL